MNFFTKTQKYTIIVLALFAILFVSLAYISTPSGALEVHFLDIGQGDAVFIQTPAKRQVLIDAGPDRSVLGQLNKVMPFYDKHIDFLIISHMHADHYKGFMYVIDVFEVDAIITPEVREHDDLSKEFWQKVRAKNIPIFVAERGHKFTLDSDVYMTVLSPWEEWLKTATINDTSLVLRLDYKNDSFLFTGDLERKGELTLAVGGADLSADVLKAGHHGSNSSSTEYFLSKVNPKISVIQVGQNNRYNHPHPNVLERLQNAGAFILRNDLNGIISMYSYGETF